MNNPLISSLFCFSLLLTACTVGPDYQPTSIDLPVDWQAASVAKPTSDALLTKNTASAEEKKATNTPKSSQNNQRNWWQDFHDPALDTMINAALLQNLDLRSATERVRETRAYLDGADASQWPEISAYAGESRLSDKAGLRSGNINTRGTRLYQTGFDASWEIDLFGGIRRQREARNAEMEAAMASRDDVELSLIAEIARTYIEYRLAEYDLQLAIRTLEAQEKTARITNARYREGVDGRFEVERANVALANTRVRQPATKERADAALFQLGFLLAKFPQELNDLLAAHPINNSTLPIAELNTVLDLPLAVIGNRPDVRVAERQLAAATANQGVAIAARYPRLTISGLLGFDSDSRSNLTTSNSKVWSLNADLLLPLIDFGRRRADVAAAGAQQQQALLNYESSVRNALADINTALSNYFREQEKLATYNQATEAARVAWTIADKQYREGILPQLEVLIAQRTLFDAELNEAQSRAELAARFIALNKALGANAQENDYILSSAK